LAHRLLA